MTVMVLSTPAS